MRAVYAKSSAFAKSLLLERQSCFVRGAKGFLHRSFWKKRSILASTVNISENDGRDTLHNPDLGFGHFFGGIKYQKSQSVR